MADKWVELMPTVQHVCYEAGVPVLRNLCEVQQAQVIAALGAKTVLAQYLERDAAIAWQHMRHAAAIEGVELWIYSGYRSHEHQQRLYAEWEQGRRKLRPARPGWSLHESGRAVDVLRSHDDPDGGGPMRGATDKWLEEHAAEYGFHRTVPGELWHWEHR